ncbi:hypothetical protein [Hymenobacter koreensis]|uniref:T9SS type A sorting domain-containing protein n=1 Tax=Hymenobacter koreensis TaxID=1084523 RepID=A0ABP8JMR8_9BACT
MRFFCVCILWLAALLGLPAQAQLLRQHVYGTTGEESYGLLTPVRGGGYLLVGDHQPRPSSNFNERLYLVRVNSQGDTLWTRRQRLGFNGINVSGVCENAAGQILVAISGANTNAVPIDDAAMLVLFNAQGDTLWTRKTGGPTIDGYTGLVLGHDGNFVLTGSLGTFPQWLKVSAAGQVLARTTINYDAGDVGYLSGLFKDASSRGGYWVENATGGTAAGARKLLHLTEAGVVDQTKPLYGRSYDNLQSVASLPNNGGYVACEGSTGRLVRFTPALDTLWTRQLRFDNGTVRGFASARQVQPLPDGTLVVAGQFFFSGGGRVYLAKLSAAGQTLRDTVLFRGAGTETVAGLAVEPGTNRYVFSGYTTSGPRGGADLFLGIHADWRVLSTRPARERPAALAAWPNPLPAGRHELVLRPGRPLRGHLALHDAAGRLVRQWPAPPAAEQRLSLAGVPPGLYLLTATDATGLRYVARVLRE